VTEIEDGDVGNISKERLTPNAYVQAWAIILSQTLSFFRELIECVQSTQSETVRAAFSTGSALR
jgi:hypothetical protein